MKISIVTITYNAEAVLQRTLDSVSSQTYRDIEHLIIDGASKDGTMDLVSRYKVRDLPYEVRVVSEPDKGIYDAMNKGLRLATGEYIVFLNAGDTLHDEKTLDMVASSLQPAANSQQPAVIYGDTNIVDDEGHFLRKRHLSVPDNLTWRSFKQGMLVCHQAFYARLDIARDIPYDLQYRHSADVDWCIRVMKEAERRHLPLVRVQGVVADFLDGGDSSKNHRASLRERFHVMRRHYGLLTTCLMHVWFLLRSVFR
ncbi:MAG: glycosyltransferase [Prevotella sp.]|jgi:glycosyltransferase involved in cell wall biosynthesis|nr:glycosyltransferase [Prevotella sp.]